MVKSNTIFINKPDLDLNLDPNPKLMPKSNPKKIISDPQHIFYTITLYFREKDYTLHLSEKKKTESAPRSR
jgi:hypothetical protein